MTDPPSLRISPSVLTDPDVLGLLAALPEARVVGGAVRDALAGHPVADIDIATPRPPDDVTAALRKAGIRSVPTGLAHGTVTAVLHGRGFEVTTLRRDIETDGRHAIVAFTGDWRQDAARRDFTINAMSMAGDGAVFDYFGGIEDLRAGVLRFVGEPAARIAEDYLRILRYFRFYARYAAVPPDAKVETALREGVPGIAGLSVERIWNELARILAAPDPRTALRLMASLGVLAAILPEGADPAALERLAAAGAPPDPLLRLAAILTGDALSVAIRFKLSIAERDRLVALHATPIPQPDSNDDALRRLLADTDTRTLIGRSWLAGDPDPAWAELRSRLTAMPRPVFPLAGRDALSLGIPPGPEVGSLLREIRKWWLDGGCRADANACRSALLARIRPDGQ